MEFHVIVVSLKHTQKLTFLKENPMLSSFLHFDFETESDEERKVDDETKPVVNLLNKL